MKIDHMTDEWIEEGNYSDRTVMDLRNQIWQLESILRKTLRFLAHSSNCERQSVVFKDPSYCSCGMDDLIELIYKERNHE